MADTTNLLLTDLRKAVKSGKGIYEHRLLCGKAAAAISDLHRQHDEDVNRMERAAETVESLNSQCNELVARIDFAIGELDASQPTDSGTDWVKTSVLAVLRGQLTPSGDVIQRAAHEPREVPLGLRECCQDFDNCEQHCLLLIRTLRGRARAAQPPPAARCVLPVITVQMIADFVNESFMEKTDEPTKGVPGVNWSQAAVDFAFLIQGTAPTKLPAPTQEAQECLYGLHEWIGGQCVKCRAFLGE